MKHLTKYFKTEGEVIFEEVKVKRLEWFKAILSEGRN